MLVIAMEPRSSQRDLISIFCGDKKSNVAKAHQRSYRRAIEDPNSLLREMASMIRQENSTDTCQIEESKDELD